VHFSELGCSLHEWLPATKSQSNCNVNRAECEHPVVAGGAARVARTHGGSRVGGLNGGDGMKTAIDRV